MFKKFAYFAGWSFIFIAFGFFFMDFTGYLKAGHFHSTSITSYCLGVFPVTYSSFIKGSGILWEVLKFPLGWPAWLVSLVSGAILIRSGK